MHFKKSSKFAAVTIPGVGIVQGELVLTGPEYAKYVALGLLESCDAPAPVAAPLAPPAGGETATGGSDGHLDSTSKSEETDDSDTKPPAKKTGAKR